ncbi:EAL domain-containing protein [Acaryochloris sp. IP29b_bin.148]|uniref:putative bifunctional diguanylate cyclase/phosphodiesterase n=1 Tax=Acaryochloris sp. IP29b_bin.148 TaxID=2969218 RepID=UPI00262D88C7|nr:EAL domain-containing protein [Acaryochloris sp. IP29b_bin.148]
MQNACIQVLMIEDNILDVEIVQELLTDGQGKFISIEHRATLAAGLERLKDNHSPIDIALLDLHLTDAHGLDCFHQVHQAFPELPLIILSGNTDATLALEAVQQGAQDYLIKSRFNGKLLQRSIYYAIERQKLHLELKVKTQQLQDLSDQLQQTNHTLEQLAKIDGLTQVNNRRQFDQIYLTEWHRLCREQQPLSVLLCDVDYFKAYNDTYAHQAGDRCLQQVAQAIAASTKRPADCVARYGGEEFVVILPQTDLAGAAQVADIIHANLRQLHLPHTTSPVSNQVTLSIGAACQIPQREIAPSLLISAADQALYMAKKQGRNCTQLHQHHSTHQGQGNHQTLQWIDKLSRAMEQDQFQLYVQPIQALNAVHTNPHYEILLRLQDPTGTVVTPETFLSIAEDSELMARIDRWVIQHLFEQLSSHAAAVLQSYRFHINLSNATCKNQQLIEVIQGLVRTYGVQLNRFCFEVSESVAIANLANTSQLTQALQAGGAQVVLDNFGSSTSSFAYLKQIPVDYLKIAGLFIKEMETDAVSKEIVHSIHNVAAVMDAQTIAMCVESQAVLNALKPLGVNYIQGHYLGQPRPLVDLLATLE